MQPAIRIARLLSAALVAVLLACGMALSGASGGYAAPSGMPQHTHAVPEQHITTAHLHRVTVVTPRGLDHPGDGGDSGPAASLGSVGCAAPTGVVVLADRRLAAPHLHQLAPSCARAPPV